MTRLDLLEPLRSAGVLAPSDAHVAATLTRLCDVDDDAAAVATALAARAPRRGDVCVDLSTVVDQVRAEIDAEPDLDPSGAAAAHALIVGLPDVVEWCDRLAATSLVGTDRSPLVLSGRALYLERYHVAEQRVAVGLLRRAHDDAPAVARLDPEVVTALFADDRSGEQRSAVERTLGRRLTVLVGGPGTGKTTTVAAVLAALLRADDRTDVALAAPTGKAAARLTEAVHASAGRLPLDVQARLLDTSATTIHRLLGPRRSAPRVLPHDVVIVDETSMVSLPLMAQLLDAVRPDARLVLVGDPDQLASVEAGAVLHDIVASARADPSGRLAACVDELSTSHRFPPGSAIGTLADAIRNGDPDAALEVLAADGDARDAVAVQWCAAASDDPAAVDVVRSIVEPVASAVRAAATDDPVADPGYQDPGDQDPDDRRAAAALEAVGHARLICAHRRGPAGVERWNAMVESWLADAGRFPRGWYAGRPVLVTANDHRLGLYNGDLGVVVDTPDGPRVGFPTGDGVRLIAPAALDAVETVHAMTIHKSQGSEFDHVVVVVPPAESRLATRELLYTAITRARRSVTVVGLADDLAAAIRTPTLRVSGLAAALAADPTAVLNSS